MKKDNIVIKAENISKLYRIGQKEATHENLVEAFLHVLKSPLKNYRKYRSLYKFDDYNIENMHFGSDNDDIIWALKNVSFEIRPGEVVGVIGKNGAGKSTLLKILSRITTPSSGCVAVRGRVTSLLEVGTGFHPELTGRDNIYLNGAILGMTKSEIKRKFDDIVDFSGIEKFIDTPVKRYSSGMNVRLAFSVAAHLEPEILIVDEVLAVGDAAFQAKCLGKMETVAKEGRTVLLVSHNMAAIEHLCKRTILLSGGVVLMDGETDKVIRSYLSTDANTSRVPLHKRTDRDGIGDILATAIEILDVEGRNIDIVLSGQKAIIRVYYQCKNKRKYEKCQITALVHRDNHFYFILSTSIAENKQVDITNDGFLDFIIPEFPLAEGRYYINLVIQSNNEYQDTIKKAAEINVLDGDFFGSGRVRPQKGWRATGVLVKHSYHLCQ